MPDTELQVIWPRKALDDAAAALQRAQLDLGIDIDTAVTTLAVYVARSAGTRTKAAPQTRKAYPNDGTGQSAVKWPYFRRVWTPPNKGPNHYVRHYLKAAGDSSFEKITNSGLAKKSWNWTIPGIKYGQFENFASASNRAGKGADLVITIRNKLPYILFALKKQDGDYLLAEALAKGASQLQKKITRRLEGRR